MMNELIENLQDIPHWLCWKKVQKDDGSFTKVPYKPDTHNQCASVTKPDDWSLYQDAKALADEGRFSGVGFVLDASIPYVCIDLDHCIDKESGELKEPAASIVEMVKTSGGTYTEISPSGEGLHVWGLYEGALPGGKTGIKKNGIEIYRDKRFMTVTGEAFDNSPLGDLTSVVQEIIERYGLMEKAPAATAPKVTKMEEVGAAPAIFSDDFLIEKARTAKNGSKFSALFDRGDTSGYVNEKGEPGESEADVALLDMLAFWTNGNAMQMERLFMRSALGTPERLARKKHKDNGYIRNISIPKALAFWRKNGANCYKLEKAIIISQREPGQKEAPPEKPARKEDVLSLDPEDWTDTANAERIAAWYGDTLKCCVDYKKPDNFVRFTGKIWERITEAQAYQYSNKAMNRILFSIAKEREKLAIMQQEAATRGDVMTKADDPNDFLHDLEKKVYTNQNRRPINSAIDVLRGMNTCKLVDFDAAPYDLNCGNGLLNLETGELSPHSPADMCMKCTPVSYVKAPKSHVWKDTVASILPDAETRHYLQKVLGSALQGKVAEQEVYFLVGCGGNGKGIIMESVKAALGDYAVTINPEIILTSKNGMGAGDRPTPSIAALKGARLAVCGETDQGRTLSVGTLKRLTGGDTLTGREAYGRTNIEFEPTHSIVFSTNCEPAIEDAGDQGLKRRLREIIFTETFSEEKGNMDVHLSSKLKEKAAQEEILSWLVEGFTMYRREGLTPPPAVRKATAKYFDSNDYIGDFISTYCEIGEEYEVERGKLYSLFQRVCREEYGQYPMTARAFYQIMEHSQGFKTRKSNGARLILGIRIKGPSNPV